jgi:hypothetical protein
MRWMGLFLALIASSGHAQTSLWEISRDGYHLYLGGTLHMLGADGCPLPLAYDNAYESNARLILETYLEEMQMT